MYRSILTGIACLVLVLLGRAQSTEAGEAVVSAQALEVCRQHSDPRSMAYDPGEALDECKRVAEADPATAGEIVCKIYARRAGREDFVEALKWCRRSGDAGSSWAQFQAANMLLDGLGGARDVGEAISWMRRAAEQGHELAKRDLVEIEGTAGLDQRDQARRFFDLAIEYLRGNSPNAIAAFRWMHRAADLENPIAQLNFANMLLRGQGMDAPQPLMSIGYFRKAIEQGNVQAMFDLGVVYVNGQAGEPRPDEGIRLIAAAAQRSNPAAMLELGELLTKGNLVKQNIDAGLDYTGRAADAGYPQAQLVLGIRLVTGDLVERNILRGVGLLAKAADSGLTQAQLVLGQIYQRGDIVTADPEKARSLLGLAADSGSTDAMLALATMERSQGGRGAAAGRVWYLRAAEQMDPRALIALAEGAADGALGESLFQAYSWAAAAVSIYPNNKVYEEALKLRNEIGAKLSMRQRLDASVAALKWLMENFPDRYHPILTGSSSAP